LIDDDFESVFRRIFESLISSMGSFPEGSTTYSYNTGSMYNDFENDDALQEKKDSDVERIDLEDEVLFLVNIGYEDREPSVRVDVGSMTITPGTLNQPIKVDLDFEVDVANSYMSSRNGVLEISLKVAEKGSSGAREGFLISNQ
jgi:hypothetical protein